MSGAKDSRPSLDTRVRDAKSRRFDTLIVRRLDRPRSQPQAPDPAARGAAGPRRRVRVAVRGHRRHDAGGQTPAPHPRGHRRVRASPIAERVRQGSSLGDLVKTGQSWTGKTGHHGAWATENSRSQLYDVLFQKPKVRKPAPVRSVCRRPAAAAPWDGYNGAGPPRLGNTPPTGRFPHAPTGHHHVRRSQADRTGAGFRTLRFPRRTS